MSGKLIAGDLVRITDDRHIHSGLIGRVAWTDQTNGRVHVRFDHSQSGTWGFWPEDVVPLGPVELLALLAKEP